MMVCSNCGAKIKNGFDFCPKCGNKTVKEYQMNPLDFKDNTTTSKYNNSEMVDKEGEIIRDVLLQHLEDLRVLEVSRLKLNKKIEKCEEQISKLCHEKKYEKPAVISSIILVFFISFMIIFMLFVLINAVQTDDAISTNSGLNILTGSSVEALIVALVPTIISVVVRMSKLNNYKCDIKAEEEKMLKETNERDLLYQENAQNKNALAELEVLLKDTYGINLIPSPFRNINGIVYLYEYLSTSYESLQSAIMNYNIDRLNQNLYSIAEQQGEMIMQQYYTNMHLENMQKQNQNLIKNMVTISENTALNTKYSSIAAANSSTMNFFMTYDFLKN